MSMSSETLRSQAEAKPQPIRIAVAGAGGRMGRMLIEAIDAADDCVLSGALDVPDAPGVGSDAGAFLGKVLGVPISACPRAGLDGARALIDFTRPEGTLAHLAVCRELGVAAVIGTTGTRSTRHPAPRSRWAR